MSELFVLLWMLFMHIIDDFVLQDTLARMKQKEWWMEQEGYTDKYKNDWIPSLMCHAFEWAFMIMIPIAYWKYSFDIDTKFCIVFLVNYFIHLIVDHLKANIKCINLCNDQNIHFMQVLVTWILFVS